jgi:phage tail tube protein FII
MLANGFQTDKLTNKVKVSGCMAEALNKYGISDQILIYC